MKNVMEHLSPCLFTEVAIFSREEMYYYRGMLGWEG